jgi:hypothetical protein
MVTCEPKGDNAFSDVISAVVDENHLAKEANSQSPILEAENVGVDDIATILYTSGTTGKRNLTNLIKFCRFTKRCHAHTWKFNI